LANWSVTITWTAGTQRRGGDSNRKCGIYKYAVGLFGNQKPHGFS
jgi:hypothetical protein